MEGSVVVRLRHGRSKVWHAACISRTLLAVYCRFFCVTEQQWNIVPLSVLMRGEMCVRCSERRLLHADAGG